MSVRLLRLPTAFLLSLLTMMTWIYLVTGAGTGIRVLNQSGEVLQDVQVCLKGAGCVFRDRLWPHQAWKVPLRATGPQHVEVTTAQDAVQARLDGRGQMQFVVRQNGEIQALP